MHWFHTGRGESNETRSAGTRRILDEDWMRRWRSSSGLSPSGIRRSSLRISSPRRIETRCAPTRSRAAPSLSGVVRPTMATRPPPVSSPPRWTSESPRNRHAEWTGDSYVDSVEPSASRFRIGRATSLHDIVPLARRPAAWVRRTTFVGGRRDSFPLAGAAGSAFREIRTFAADRERESGDTPRRSRRAANKTLRRSAGER